MLENTASAVSSTVGLEASFSTTLSLQKKSALKCMYFEITCIYKVTYHRDHLFKNISGENPAYTCIHILGLHLY